MPAAAPIALLLLLLTCVQGGYDPRYPNMLPAGGGASQAAGPGVSCGYAARYSGHQNNHPSRNVVWLGNRSQYVLSGADDGSLFVWDAASTQVVNIVRGGSSAIRRVQVRAGRLVGGWVGTQEGSTAQETTQGHSGCMTSVAAAVPAGPCISAAHGRQSFIRHQLPCM